MGLNISCQMLPGFRGPASIEKTTANEVQYYENQIQKEVLEDEEKYQSELSALYDRPSPLMMGGLKYGLDQKQKAQLQSLRILSDNYEAQLIKNSPQAFEPVTRKGFFQKNWRQNNGDFTLHQLNNFKLGANKEIQAIRTLSTDTTNRIYLQLTNKIYSWNKKVLPLEQTIPMKNPVTYINAEIMCNYPFVFLKQYKKINIQANQKYKFNWYDEGYNAEETVIALSQQDTVCDLKFSQDDKYDHGVRFIPEIQQLAKLDNPHLEFEACYLPTAEKLGGMEAFFLEASSRNLLCPQKVNSFRTLEKTTDGLNAKVKALTGTTLSDEYIKKGDPFVKVDMSKAPKLDGILISYLVFRSDFYGNVLLEALKYHAARGTIIRIAVSDVISLGKDRQQLLDLQAKYPNVKLNMYRYKSKNLGFRDGIAALHRTNHIKLFLTYSKNNSDDNVVILGGRNIHDGFLFEQPNANYIYPTLVDYRPNGDESWARWEDFEAEFKSQSLAQSIMGQYFSVLHADYSTLFNRNYSVNIQTEDQVDPNYFKLNPNEVLIRTFVSVPFKDNMALEKQFIRMIDSAQKEINISTPYFHVTDGLLKAFSRASERGVKIRLITRLDLDGDTADFVLSEVNKGSINKIMGKVQVFEYTTKGKILHSKLFMIDDKFVMMGSVNLNKRSFYHDIENAVMVYGQGFNQKMNAIYENYLKESVELTEKQKLTFWKQMIIKLAETEL